jgi:hypothetical protein
MFFLIDYIKIFFIPFLELLKALIDQSHFHVKSFFHYASISGNIVINFVKYCFIFYYVHVCHLLYLKKIGFLGIYKSMNLFYRYLLYLLSYTLPM